MKLSEVAEALRTSTFVTLKPGTTGYSTYDDCKSVRKPIMLVTTKDVPFEVISIEGEINVAHPIIEVASGADWPPDHYFVWIYDVIPLEIPRKDIHVKINPGFREIDT